MQNVCQMAYAKCARQFVSQKSDSLFRGTSPKRLRADNPALCRRVIFFSGDVVNGQMREFLEQEKRPCLAKPFAFGEVRAAITDILKA